MRRKCWRWSTGSYGATVTVFERIPGGPLYMGIPLPQGGYKRESLGHTDREAAQRQAVEIAARRRAGQPQPGRLTVAAMMSNYVGGVRGKSPEYVADTVRAAGMWTRWLGSDLEIRCSGDEDERRWKDKLTEFVRLRISGHLDACGHLVASERRKPVGPRAVARDLKAFRAACSTVTIPGGGDPTRRLEIPLENNPKRPVADADRFDALMAIADRVTMRHGRGKQATWERSHLRTILRLAGDTGRRISSILALRWADWHPELGTFGKFRWRADEDKLRTEWWAPVTSEVRDEIERVRRERPGVGEALVFPAPNYPAVSVSVRVASDWLHAAEVLGNLEPFDGGVWHPSRRRWASERKHWPLKDVAFVGGWKDTATLLQCYMAADDETMEAVVSQPKRLRRRLG
jgi:integrase